MQSADGGIVAKGWLSRMGSLVQVDRIKVSVAHMLRDMSGPESATRKRFRCSGSDFSMRWHQCFDIALAFRTSKKSRWLRMLC